MLEKLKLQIGAYSVVIPLDLLTTVIMGDGNVGKTCIFNYLRTNVNNKKIRGNFLFINAEMLHNVPLLKNITNDYFVVIDGYDKVKTACPEVVNYIIKYKPQVLLFGRDVFDLPCNKHFVFFATRDDKKKRIILEPMLPPDNMWL